VRALNLRVTQADVLGEVDRRIVELLKQDGRMSYADMAAAVGLSGDAVRERLKRLESQGMVSVIGSVSPQVLGYTSFALVALTARGSAREAAAAVAEVRAVDLVACVTGRYDVLVQVVCRDDRDLLAVIDESIRSIPNVKVAEVFPFLTVDKYSAGFDPRPAPKESRTVVDVTQLDAQDRSLIKALQADGRATFRTLEAASGLPYSSARRRVLHLIESGLVRIVTVENPLTISSRVQAAVGLKVQGSTATVRQALNELPEVEVAVTTAGSFDLMLEVVCQDKPDLGRLIDQRLRALPGVVATETWQYLDLVKLPYTWAGLEHMSLGT
jgi:DNA-binding Lrp family transcriptional regulator